MRKPLEYDNFDVTVYKDGEDRFKVFAKGDPRFGEMSHAGARSQSYDPQRFWDNPSKKTGGYLGRLEERHISEDDIYKLGRLLADMVLPDGEDYGDVRKKFRANMLSLEEKHRALRLRLSIEPAWLSHLPWEYMYLSSDVDKGANEPSKFLALQQNISIVRTEHISEERNDFLPLPVTRMVGVLPEVIGPGLPYLELNVDRDTIEEIVANLYPFKGDKTLKKVEWAGPPATVASLQELLKEKTHIFHYSGHARFVPDPISDQMKGQLLLEKEKGEYDVYSNEEFTGLLTKKVYLVVLNACETANRDCQRVWGGIAVGLVREQIPLVIANQFSIRDTNARLLTKHLYENLLSGYTIDEALYKARMAIYNQKHSVGARDWGVPVLYMRDQVEATLFPPQQRKAKEDFFHKLLSHYNDSLTVLARIVTASVPFTEGDLIKRFQRDAVLEDIQQLKSTLRSAQDLLKTAEKDTLGSLLIQRLPLIAKLDGVKQWGDKLWSHITDFPADGKTLSTPKQRGWVLRDLERLQDSMRIVLVSYQDILPRRMERITSITELLNGSQDG